MSREENVWDAWLREPRLDGGLRSELAALVGAGDRAELEERFAGDLQFGTGGMRAKMGAGTDRLNVHTVRKASQGVAAWIAARAEPDARRLAVCFDGRRQSREFALEAALVAARNGIAAYLFDAARPTPLLSFAVRFLGCAGGVMITASYNPPEYNGYKVYGSDGVQLLPAEAETIIGAMRAIPDLFAIARADEEEARRAGLLKSVPADVEEAYFAALRPLYSRSAPPLRIVYTPLHGTGLALVPRALREAGFPDVRTVALQSRLDPEFTHVQSPNPEEPRAYDLALAEARAGGADLILATDPDADRVGVMAKDGAGYRFFTGNEAGALLLDGYLRRLRRDGGLKPGATVITTNVTSDFGAAVAASYGVDTVRVLTGFKYIGARIGDYERSGGRHFVFGYEESVGYLALPFVRDKDSVQAAVLAAQVAAEHKAAGRTLAQALAELFARFGHYGDRLLGFAFAGQSGAARMEKLMDDLRRSPLSAPGLALSAIEDCLAGARVALPAGARENLDLPSSDVLKFYFGERGWVAVRPSGTEPKLKVYIGVKARSEEESRERLALLERAVEGRLASYLSEE